MQTVTQYTPPTQAEILLYQLAIPVSYTLLLPLSVTLLPPPPTPSDPCQPIAVQKQNQFPITSMLDVARRRRSRFVYSVDPSN